MGWFDDEDIDDEPKKQSGIFDAFFGKPNDKNKKNDVKKTVSILGLFDEEIDELKNNNWDPDAFEDDEMEEDDYYSEEDD